MQRHTTLLLASGLVLVAGLGILSRAAGASDPRPTLELGDRIDDVDGGRLQATELPAAPNERVSLPQETEYTAKATAAPHSSEPTCSLDVTVIDAISGAPIPMFRVFCRSVGQGESDDDGHPPSRISRHDPGGRFHLTGLTKGTYDVVIDAGAAGYESTVIHDVTVPGSEPLIARVGRGTHVEGRVLDGIGRPVPGVKVVLAEDNPSSHRSPSQVATRTTDAAGRFLFTRLRSGSYRLSSAGAARRETTTIPVRERARVEKDLRLAGANTLTVTVVDRTGQPLEGSRVSLACRDGVVQSESTGSDGTTRIGALTGDGYTVHVSHSGYRPENRTVQMPRTGDRDVQIALAHR